MSLQSTCRRLSQYLGIRYVLNCLRKCVFANNSAGKLAVVIVLAVPFIVYIRGNVVPFDIDISNTNSDIKFWICTLLNVFLLHFGFSQLFLLLERFRVQLLRFKKVSERRWNNFTWIIFIIICLLLYMMESKWKTEEIYNAMLYAFFFSIILTLISWLEEYSDAEINSCQDCPESIGAYWALHAHDSYYESVLSNIQERMLSFEEEHNLKLLVKKLVLVIPLSCNVIKTLAEKDGSMTYIEHLPIHENDQGANINRVYKNPVYKIETSDKDIYIASECPNSLMTLWKTKDHMDNMHWIYHRDCFIRTLKDLVKDSPCIVVIYDDTIESPKALHKVILSDLNDRNCIVINMEN